MPRCAGARLRALPLALQDLFATIPGHQASFSHRLEGMGGEIGSCVCVSAGRGDAEAEGQGDGDTASTPADAAGFFAFVRAPAYLCGIACVTMRVRMHPCVRVYGRVRR